MRRLTEFAHQQLADHLRRGDAAIDATAGNGHDTLELARLVGTEGRVVAVDLQDAALGATRRQLNGRGWLDRCELHLGDHATVLAKLEGSFQAAVFNLGYLPGSDKSVRTAPTTTLAALDHCRRLLAPGGLLLVTAYRGHPGGPEEAEAVADWMQTREDEGWPVRSIEPEATGPQPPPILWIARKG
ncbi:MAG: tRNA (mnm(5)s(2)U34)-methyltransferase [Verrucomicrobiota bacterium]